MSKNIKDKLNIIEPGFLENIKHILKNKKKLWRIIMLFSMVFFVAAVVGFTWYFLLFSKDKETPLSQKQAEAPKEGEQMKDEPCEGCVRRKLDGVYVEPEMANFKPVAVMIDNHPQARPPHGLDEADLVYEAEVEGRFTRFMAVFDPNKEIPKIGPVRSARPYFVDWSDGLGALYCHCGGSPQALAEIALKGITDLNEFYNEDSYWRSKDRPAPHNIFTSTEKLKEYIDNGENEKDHIFRSWKYKKDDPMVISPYPKIEIKFKSDEMAVKWEYKREGNSYLRYLNGKEHFTAEKNEIRAKNLIIQYIPAKVLDEKLRLKMNTTGWGKAVICLDGTCTNGQWAKPDSQKRTVFFYEDGEEVEFNTGKTWIEVVRPDVEVIF